MSFGAVPFEANLETPESLPLFLRDLDPKTIRDVVLGDLMNSVFLFLDWSELSKRVAAEGAELTWSSFKDGRRQQARPREQRLLTIGERIPRFTTKDGKYIEGFSKLYRIYFDGITPASIVAQYVGALEEPTPPLPSGDEE